MEGQTFSISKPTTTIGREATNDIVVKNDARVSRVHARLVWRDSQWSIENLSQSSFLAVNSQKVQLALISNNTVIGLGGVSSFVFLTSASAQLSLQETMLQTRPAKEEPPPSSSRTLPPSPEQASEISDTPINISAPPQQDSFTTQSGQPGTRSDATQIASLTSIGLPSIEVSSYSHSDKITYALAKPVINIGRDATNDIIINDRLVSGLHLRIVRQGNVFVLIQTGQTLSMAYFTRGERSGVMSNLAKR